MKKAVQLLWKRHREIAIELISLNAGVDLKDLHGTTSLMAASTKGHYKIVEELINNNADVNCQDNKGNRALHLVLMENINDATINIVELLLSDRTNLEKRNKKKKTAIQLSQESKKQDVIDMIKDFFDSRRVEAAKLEANQIINKGKRELAREMTMNDEVLNLKEIIDQMETANATLEEGLERNREELTAKRYLLKKKVESDDYKRYQKLQKQNEYFEKCYERGEFDNVIGARMRMIKQNAPPC